MMRRWQEDSIRKQGNGKIRKHFSRGSRTRNAESCKMLKLDHKLGTIEVGKDADLVWTENPLSIYATVNKNFLDGKP